MKQTPEEIVSLMAKDIEGRMPMELDLRRAHEETFKITNTGEMNSLGVFVGQEIERMNKLLKTIKSSLYGLQKAIKGEVVMSFELEAMFSGFIDKKVPGVIYSFVYSFFRYGLRLDI